MNYAKLFAYILTARNLSLVSLLVVEIRAELLIYSRTRIWESLKSRSLCKIVGPRFSSLVENVVQFLKRCRKGSILSGSGRVRVRTVMADKAGHQAWVTYGKVATNRMWCDWFQLWKNKRYNNHFNKVLLCLSCKKDSSHYKRCEVHACTVIRLSREGLSRSYKRMLQPSRGERFTSRF